ncbi:MAG: disulfide bond formation protein B [Methylobacteriaceae bacterium]|nr:disulfide bond formation protein B [Methylobacteriaceae bacterium]
MSAAELTRGRPAATLVLAVAAATILGALASQHLFGLIPCKLCLEQRQPYYLGLPLALATLLAPPGSWRRLGLALLALLFVWSAALAINHAGVEWGFWLGPADCAGGGANPASVGDLMAAIQRSRVVSCTEAAWRFLGLSLAGWNALISLGLALFAAQAAWRSGGR